MNKIKMKNNLSIVIGIIEAIILFVFGILIVSLKNSPNNVFNILVGVVLIIVSLITIVTDIYKNKSLMTENAAVNIAMISIAVLAFWDKSIPVERYIAYFVITFGGYLIVEMLLSLIFKRGVVGPIISGVVGLGFICIGISFLTNDKVRDVIYIIAGIILIIVAILIFMENLLVLVLYNKSTKEVKVVNEKANNSIDAKVEVVNEDVNSTNKEENNN
ncbi:MAG: hypothetical protein K6E20_07215 [Acholeplasmatales bacterium]|nr:hypothetical protein [Acholeplasmatales bacterium]